MKGFTQDICEIPVSFERCCRRLGSLEKMKERQIINQRSAEVLESLLPTSADRREIRGKKGKAFLLFSQGKRPSDTEVKVLGIKPNTACRYYQAWKQTRSHSQV